MSIKKSISVMLVVLVVLVVGCAIGGKMWWAALVAYLVMVGITGFVVFVYTFVSKNPSSVSSTTTTSIAGTTGVASVVPAKNGKNKFVGMVKWAVVLIAVGGGIWYFKGLGWQTPQEIILWETTGTATLFGAPTVVDLSQFKDRDVSVTWESNVGMRVWATTDKTPKKEMVGIVSLPVGESFKKWEFQTVNMPTGRFSVKVTPNIPPRK